ncbi:Golgin imh1 [Recurvomyces mirabilis]|uniref:Golgin imh1 n=1 Tax=Recurvomyces mirabilis TaxID=574656 RepID=A0AAE1C5X8_9PEZI|nr:Golgin imh1 [Recurvomyces mirabilis]KAK5158860.1 Golgin imh1 [Recurvomyces mirabilis]
MFNRLKNFNLDALLDSKIAEEQAKQAKQSQSPKRSGSNAGARRNSGRTDSPARRAGSRLRAADAGDAVVTGKSPDPEDFVIGDDASDISRVATPMPTKESADGPQDEEGKKDVSASTNQKGKEKAVEEDELPDDVRKKLAKLETLTGRYQDLLRNYRTAHARVVAIEPFEATLREHTPLTSIQEPGALVEFLNQRALQSQMVLEELKSVTGEREDLKTKLQEAENKAKEAFDEAAGLREQRQGNAKDSRETTHTSGGDPLGVSHSSAAEKTPASGEDEDFFSYDAEQKQGIEDEIKAYVAEIQEHKDYINELSTENATLRKDLDMCQLNLNAMENKVGVKDRDLDGVKQALGEAKEEIGAAGKARVEAEEQEHEAAALLAQTEGQVLHLQERLKGYQQSLQDREQELKEKAALAEENLKKYQDEHAENLKKGTYSQRDEKGIQTLRGLVNTLREQSQQAENSKLQAEGQARDLRFELNKLESEANTRGNLLEKLRHQEGAATAFKRKLAEAEQERDEAQRLADSKKGHEASAASLRVQLKTAFKERDDAYQMILDCGKCKLPEKEHEKLPETPTQISTPEPRSRMGSESTEVTEASTLPTTPGTPSVDGEPESTEAKKKNKKKKSKAKKKPLSEAASESTTTVSAPTIDIDELIANPEKAREMLKQDGAAQNVASQLIPRYIEKLRSDTETQHDGREEVIHHHEQVIEERNQTISDYSRLIREKDQEIEALRHAIGRKEEAIERLDRKLKGEEELKEEIQSLRDDMVEIGAQATDAKHELKIVREQKQSVQHEVEELQIESDQFRKEARDAQAQRNDLSSRCQVLEKEIVALKGAQSSTSTATAEELQAVKEKLSGAEKDKEALQLAKETCEKQIEELKTQHGIDSTERAAKHKSLGEEFAQLESKASSLEKDLAAANDLAQTRFKDLSEVREHSNKLQPELKRLREEAAELQTVRAELEKSGASLKRLEGKEKDLRSEIAEYKSQGVTKDGEIAELRGQAKQSDERSKALEESYENARQDLEQSQSRRDEATEGRDKMQADLQKSEGDLQRSKSTLAEMEHQLKKLRDEANNLREDLQLARAQHASAQNSMSNQQDQSRELAVQMREVRGRNESLEEELMEAQRLLQERSREGETMRRMLEEVETRAEQRVREMRERMDLAVEERDRVEDEANTVGRRRSRELEELRTKLRDAEREAARASEAKGDAEKKERAFQDQQIDLEKRAARAQEELSEVREAMAQLRKSLDESERLTTALEREKAEVKNELEERQTRLEKLQKSSKAMSEELRTLQAGNKIRQGSFQSSQRSSIDTSRVMSPGPRAVSGSGNGTPVASTRGGDQSKESIDYVYLKNVLFQFLEQKEKKHQMQLVPVLGMLLHFDRQDQQKWEAAIAAR